MPFYHVMVSGQGLKILTDDSRWISVGFFKNEYVFAKSKETAIESAVNNVRKNIARQTAKEKVKPHQLRVKEEDVSISFHFWKAFIRQGFIFYPVSHPNIQ